jgi:acyl-CoA synthetase (NDP forming)
MLLRSAFAPRSVAVIGASDNPHKVGGRPILFMKRYGYRGAIYPVNPGRETVQGLAAYPDLSSIRDTPELAVVAVAGDEALAAVQTCAARGVKVAVVMASGFGETGEEGIRKQRHMAQVAARTGMRIIGPNCQGLANFATGVVANFSTVFHEMECRDGPVAILSQSGANSQAIYINLRAKGLHARHVHATGNEADVTVADLAEAIVEDPGVKLILLYMESIKRPAALASAAARAREKDIPIVAVKAGRTASGQKAASSHTGALAAEDRVVDAFFEHHGIWRAGDAHELVSAAELYCSGRRPRGKRLIFVSNSGASCVMAADYAERHGIPLARVSDKARAGLGEVLPVFANLDNPIDITGALLSNNALFGQVLPIVGDDRLSDLVLAGLPVAGMGYDVPMFARDLASFAKTYETVVAVAAPQEAVRAEFSKAGIATFAREGEAMDALAQLADHSALLRKSIPKAVKAGVPIASGKDKFLNEAQSLEVLKMAGIAVIEHRLCRTAAEAGEAARALGPDIVMKACSIDLPHKSDHGLVALGVADPLAEFARQRARCAELGARFEGVIVSRRAGKGRELALGARHDAQFGPVVLVGDGGIYLEALKDFALLIPPFDSADVKNALQNLRVAPLLGALRGRAALDVEAFAAMAVRLGEAMLGWGPKVASVDVNPVMVFETGAAALDALIERGESL